MGRLQEAETLYSGLVRSGETTEVTHLAGVARFGVVEDMDGKDGRGAAQQEGDKRYCCNSELSAGHPCALSSAG